MKNSKTLIIAALVLLLVGIGCADELKCRGFRATSTPSAFETVAYTTSELEKAFHRISLLIPFKFIVP
jgi:hypothetical protein